MRPLLLGAASFDLRDEKVVAEYLASFDSFSLSPSEGRNYVDHSLRRFIITTEMVPPPQPGQRLLEIGAHPYYTSVLLHRFRPYDIYSANFFGDAHERVGRQVVTSALYGESYECNFVNINVERDRLPYDDRTFDVVLFCEVIEHLTQDPTFALLEMHRVLKPGGHLLVTTPNVHRVEHLLRMLSASGNVFHPYSGHGVYGRHQREYAMSELRDLLEGCGYLLSQAKIMNYEPSHASLTRALKSVWPERRDNLFVLARAGDSRRSYYPGWLYIARDAMRRVVDSDVTIGINDLGHLHWGWWGEDKLPAFSVRWTTARANGALALPGRAGRELVVEATGLGQMLGPVEVRVAAGASACEWHLGNDEWRELVVPIADGLSGETLPFEITARPVRSPLACGVSADSRELGIMVRRICIR
jgi:SAM-dependent methyltransferase